MRQTGYYFVKTNAGDPWEIKYYSQSAGAWLNSGKRQPDKDFAKIDYLRLTTPDERSHLSEPIKQF